LILPRRSASVECDKCALASFGQALVVERQGIKSAVHVGRGESGGRFYDYHVQRNRRGKSLNSLLRGRGKLQRIGQGKKGNVAAELGGELHQSFSGN